MISGSSTKLKEHKMPPTSENSKASEYYWCHIRRMPVPATPAALGFKAPQEKCPAPRTTAMAEGLRGMKASDKTRCFSPWLIK